MTTKLLDRVDPSRLRSLAGTAVVVGLLAGLTGALFASIAGEPSIDDAIRIEEAAAADHGEADEGVVDDDQHGDDDASVSRSDQRGFGLFSAYGLSGAAFGALVAVTAFVLRRGRADVAGNVMLAGVVLAGAFTVAPWFKYPPNPPAVGDPDTLGERQTLYVAIIVIAAVVGLAAIFVSRRIRAAGWPEHRRVAVVAAVVALPMLLAWAAMPAAPDEVTLPATLVWRFRLASLGANLTLWTVLTLGLSWVVAEASSRRSGAVPGRADQRPVSSVVS